jgi:pimeloyl-ACP methyl ester carboxylesterase
MPTSSTVIDDADRGVQLEVLIEGAGPDVILVPSALRGASDFAVVQDLLARAGYRTIAVNPRGAGKSTGPIDGATLRDAADDVAAVIRSLGDGPVHIVGHALGNIVSRATASYHSELIKTVTVMPCGGHDVDRSTLAAAIEHVARCSNATLSTEERLAALRICFFAPGNEPPQSWLDGWWPETGWVAAAFHASDPQDWWRAGGLPMLIVQPVDDVLCTVASGRETAVALGAQAWYVEVPHCGHAILPEQPEVITDLVGRFLRDHP